MVFDCFYTQEELEFMNLRKNCSSALKRLQRKVNRNPYQEDLRTPLFQAARAFNEIKEYVKPYLTEEIVKQLFIEGEVNFLRSENDILKQDKIKLEKKLLELHQKGNQHCEELKKELKNIKNEKDTTKALEGTIEKQNQLIKELNYRLSECQKKEQAWLQKPFSEPFVPQHNCAQLDERCLELENQIYESQKKEKLREAQLEEAFKEYANLKLQLNSLSEENVAKSALWSTPCQSLTELKERYRPIKQLEEKSNLRRSLDANDGFHQHLDTNSIINLAASWEDMETDDEDPLTHQGTEHLDFAKRTSIDNNAFTHLQGNNNLQIEDLGTTPEKYNELLAQCEKLQECCKQLANKEQTYLLRIQELEQGPNNYTDLEKRNKKLETDYVVLQNHCKELERNILELKKNDNALEAQANIEHLQNRIYSYKQEIIFLHDVNKKLQEKLKAQTSDDLQDSTAIATPSIIIKKPNQVEIEEYQKEMTERIEKINSGLNDIEEEINKLYEASAEKQEYLHLKELLIRNMIQLDNIDSRGDYVIRCQRSKSMQASQGLMNLLESKCSS